MMIDHMTSKKFPVIPLELLEELERRFPDKMPDSTSMDDIMRKQGNVQVIRFLRTQHDKQNSNVLNR